MPKETFYFSHDYNPRTDPKIKKLLVVHGMAGYGIFWALIEDLYNNANALPTDYDSIAYDLRIDTNALHSIINDFGLFIIEDGTFKSLSIQKRLDQRNEKSEKARISAEKRWNNANASKKYANASENNPNELKNDAIKESKGKDNKVEESTGVPPVAPDKKDVTPFWEPLKTNWVSFYKEKFSAEPTFDAAAAKNFKLILKRLEKVTVARGYEWTEDGAVKYLLLFLNRAYSDDWLKNNFLLTNLSTKFDAIVNQKKNGANQQKSSEVGKSIVFDRP